MKIVLKSIVSASSNLSALKDGYLLHNEEATKWLPIFKYGQTEYRMGILESGNWAIEVAEGLHSLSEPRRFVYVMELLEQPINTINEKIAGSFESLSIITDVDEVFPFVEIINAGLEQGSDYWAGLALNWFESLSDEKKRLLSDSMGQVVDAKWASQKLRHKAKKALKRMRRDKQ